MDISSVMGSNTAQEKEQPLFEYTAQALSSVVNGEVKLTIGENALAVAVLFDVVELAYAKVTALAFANYTVSVKTTEGDYALSRMGQLAEPFYTALCEAYNKAVLRSLFIKGNPLLTTKGDFNLSESEMSARVSAPIHIYENCVVALPPDMQARRVPLCFVNGMDKRDYELTLHLAGGESYTYAKLGYDTTPFEIALEKQVRKLRDKSLQAVKDIDPSLSTTHASQLARLTVEGVAAPFGELTTLAPSFAAALESKLSATRASESYAVFKKLGDPMQIYIGFRKNEGSASGDAKGDLSGMFGGLAGGTNPLEVLGSMGVPQNENIEASEGEALQPDPYLLWLIAPSPDGNYAAVEFAEADSATFVYRTGGDFKTFTEKLNRALEAISFKREVIRMSDEELLRLENADYLMAAQRTTALQFVRANFIGRIVHSNIEAWENKLKSLWGIKPAQSQQNNQETGKKFCGQCGATLGIGQKFCQECGAAI